MLGTTEAWGHNESIRSLGRLSLLPSMSWEMTTSGDALSMSGKGRYGSFHSTYG